MTAFYQWCLANKTQLATIAALTLSEVLPFIKSTKWNGLLQGLLSLLQKAEAPQPPAAKN